MKTILLKLAGPLQSWGTRAHFETRHTDLYPSKSAVVGLIAASMGCKRDDEETIRKLNSLHYAVRIDQAGNVLEDYQIARKYKFTPDETLERTYVTRRQYLEDAVFIVAVGCEDEQWAEKIEEALIRPYFQTFAGRRSCPLTFDSFLGCVERDVLPALEALPWQAAEWYRKRRSHLDDGSRVKLYVYADASMFPEDGHARLRRDSVVSFSGKCRMFEFRPEKETTVWADRNDPESMEEHDAFGAV